MLSAISRRLFAPSTATRFSLIRPISTSRFALQENHSATEATEADREADVAEESESEPRAVSEAGREVGTVKWFDAAKGFGFIVRDSGDDLFVHFSSVRGTGYRTLEEGQRVNFSVGAGQKGPIATDVTIKQNK